MSQSDEIVETGGETSQPVTGEVQLLQLRVGDTQQVWGDSLQVLVTPELQQTMKDKEIICWSKPVTELGHGETENSTEVGEVRQLGGDFHLHRGTEAHPGLD